MRMYVCIIHTYAPMFILVEMYLYAEAVFAAVHRLRSLEGAFRKPRHHRTQGVLPTNAFFTRRRWRWRWRRR